MNDDLMERVSINSWKENPEEEDNRAREENPEEEVSDRTNKEKDVENLRAGEGIGLGRSRSGGAGR